MKTAHKAKRQAAGYVCLSLFALSNQIFYGLTKVAAIHIDDTGMGEGLSEKEREYVVALASKYHTHGETLRKLGWRFLGKPYGRPTPKQKLR